MGEFFKIGKDTYKVVAEEGAPCIMCDIECMSLHCTKLVCSGEHRGDNTEVCFILYDQEPDEEEEKC